MLIHDIYVSFLIVHAKWIDKDKLKENYREVKRANTYDSNFSNARSDGQGHPRFWQRLSGQGSSYVTPKFNHHRVYNPKPEGGNSIGSSLPRSNGTICGSKHDFRCLADMDDFNGFDNTGHKIRHLLLLTTNVREGNQDTLIGSGLNAPNQNRFYTLYTRGEQESSLDTVTGMLNVFWLDVYALLNPSNTFSFVTQYVPMRFYMLLDVLL